jgi:hypothetical protein
MTIQQAATALILWASRQFDTLDIARAVEASEADVCRLIHAVREHVVEGLAA